MTRLSRKEASEMVGRNEELAILDGVVVQRGYKMWLSRLDSCNMAQLHKMIVQGGEPVFVLD